MPHLKSWIQVKTCRLFKVNVQALIVRKGAFQSVELLASKQCLNVVADPSEALIYHLYAIIPVESSLLKTAKCHNHDYITIMQIISWDLCRIIWILQNKKNALSQSSYNCFF